MTIVRRNQNWLPSVFNELFNDELAVRRPAFGVPAINVKECDKRYVVEVAAPGMTKEDFSVRIDEDNNLVISLEKKSASCNCKNDNGAECDCNENNGCNCNENERYLRREFSYSKFEQTMILPDDVDKDAIKASVENGILSIELPKYSVEQIKKAQRTIEIG
ncbi:MAG: Hsp20/alpha crystallin family protein [Candidatus Aphodosoma sp.]